MSNADIKSLGLALFVLKRERTSNPRLGNQPPPAEEIDGARAALGSISALQLYQALIENPELVGNYFSP